MKNVLLSIIIALSCTTLTVAAMKDYGANQIKERTYVTSGTVYNANNLTNLVCVETEDGNMWKFYEREFHKGEKIILLMDNQNTENILDDIIIKAKAL